MRDQPFQSIANVQHIYDCIIVGAGLAGLSCAKQLAQGLGDTCKILILEADSRIGGRARSIKDFAEGVILECGAAILHGESTSLYKLCQEASIKTAKCFCVSQGDGGPDLKPVNGATGLYIVKDRTGVISRYEYNSKDDSFVHAHSVYHNAVFLPPEERKKSYLQHLKQNHVSEDMLALLEAGGANTCCSTLGEIALEKMIEWNKYWAHQAGEGDHENYILAPHCMDDVVNHLAQNLDIELNSVVEKVIIEGELVNVQVAGSGRLLQAHRVVISVSLGVLKDNLIEFSPPLSKEKVLALCSATFHPIVKVFVLFSKRFWPVKFHGYVCGGFDIPEMWPNSFGKYHLFTGFATANYAKKLLRQTDEQIVEVFLSQLEVLFTPTFSRECFIKGMAYRWDKNHKPYVRGGYGAPRFSTTFNPRYSDILAVPVQNKIYFCGEGINTSEGSTAPSAIDSGVQTATKILSTG